MIAELTTMVRAISATLILLPTVIGMGWNIFYNNSFYLLMIQIIGCNLYSLFLFLYIAFPITLSGVTNLKEDNIFYYGPLFLEGFAFSGMFLFAFVIAVNRLTIFVFPIVNRKLFTSVNTFIISACLWIYISFMMIMNKIKGCTKLFSEEEFYFWYNCTDQNNDGYHYNDTIPLSVLFLIQMIAFKFIPLLDTIDSHRIVATTFNNLLAIVCDIASPILLLEHIFSISYEMETKNEVDVEASTIVRIICALFILIPTVIGMILHFIVMTVFYKVIIFIICICHSALCAYPINR
ncbi:hypothetical protein DICVIV_09711 [Dictyocaulus viviparus]|uniref:7TM GPCR serpentine receptor class x (Srx) domain-containing protein n=1 Tax=Dictyocaulus viviparus TaxID=29172 RepID=A0A0D8XPH9_DICVI|nr:hypothetical protein DICVIV_09711 [Dictyocaulus viviparus]